MPLAFRRICSPSLVFVSTLIQLQLLTRVTVLVSLADKRLLMSSVPTSAVSACLGTMEFGRYATEQQALSMVQAFVAAGYTELDTASMYVGGESERIIGRLPADIKAQCIVHTKANPWNTTDPQLKGLTYSSVTKQAHASLASLQYTPSTATPPIDIYYLHAPCTQGTPIEETLRAVHELHRAGVFRRFGLSNFSSWQVMECYQLCVQHDYVRPSVYQGMYNALTRAVEAELFPCLRRLHMAFYAYNPLAGGLLTGRYTFDAPPTEPGRFAGNEWADRYKERYWKKSMFAAVDDIKRVLAESEGSSVSMAEASLRWMMQHSGLRGEQGDCVILGASNEKHVKANLKGVKGGPLDPRVVAALDAAWQECKAECPPYFR